MLGMLKIFLSSSIFSSDCKITIVLFFLVMCPISDEYYLLVVISWFYDDFQLELKMKIKIETNICKILDIKLDSKKM